MQCFRLAHAGLVIEEGGAALFLDPGSFSTPEEIAGALAAAAPVSGVVISHEHADHWTPEHLTAIRGTAPDAPIFSTAATVEALSRAGVAGATAVRPGDTAHAGDFALEFYGGTHELLHRSIPVIDNVGVRVNGSLAWGGDSLIRPPFEVETLGVPIGSPWSNIGQVMDFVLDAAPRRAYLTHDGMLSNAGLGLYAQRVQWCLDQSGGELLQFPRPGQR